MVSSAGQNRLKMMKRSKKIMPELGPEHPVTFRQETASVFFDRYVKAGESCVIVSVAGGGLRRFVDFLLRTDVQQHYLGDAADAPLLLKVDCNRIHDVSEWGLCELMLTALVEGCNLRPQTVALQPEINNLRLDVIMKQNALLAQRHLELAVDILVTRANLQLYFLLSEFDELFKTLPDLVLNHLRAVRDAHKYTVNFALCLHRFPEQLRPALKDMLSARIAQNVLRVGLYSMEDASRMLDQLETRKGRRLSPPMRQMILHLSGRHAGLIHGIYSALVGADGDGANLGESRQNEKELLEWLMPTTGYATLSPTAAVVECERLWDGLDEEEQEGLQRLAGQKTISADVLNLLESKDLVEKRGRQPLIFSPLFARFVRQQSSAERVRIMIDEDTRIISIGERVISDVSPLVYRLLQHLYHHLGHVCDHEEIINEVYSGQYNVSDSSLASLVRQARQKIEPPDSPYQFLVNVRGVGYKLLEFPEIKEPDAVISE
jgi:DNA-binding winged helix-turn-helix (wHTH) protein